MASTTKNQIEFLRSHGDNLVGENQDGGQQVTAMMVAEEDRSRQQEEGERTVTQDTGLCSFGNTNKDADIEVFRSAPCSWCGNESDPAYGGTYFECELCGWRIYCSQHCMEIDWFVAHYQYCKKIMEATDITDEEIRIRTLETILEQNDDDTAEVIARAQHERNFLIGFLVGTNDSSDERVANTTIPM